MCGERATDSRWIVDLGFARMHQDGVEVPAIRSDTGPPARIETSFVTSISKRLHSGIGSKASGHALRLGIAHTRRRPPTCARTCEHIALHPGVSMKAFQLIGGSAKVDATTALNNVAQPDPGPGQVLIRIGGAGACHSDISLMEFSAGGPRETPMTLGHENAGWIEAFGPGTVATPGLEIGSPVAVYGAWGCGQCSNCRKGMENYCLNISASGPGLSVDGGMAEYLLVPAARYLVPLGDMAPAEAAPLTDAGLTPYHAIKQALPLLVPGSFVVVIGAGGLGHLAVQFLKALSPATVIAVDQRESALKVVAGLGADHTVVMSPDAAAEIRGITGGRGAEVILDICGYDDTLALAAAVAAPLGRLTVVGVGGGTLPFSFFTFPYECSVQSTYWGSITELGELLELSRSGGFRVHAETYALDQAREVYNKMVDGTLQGRAVIVP